MKLVPGPLPPLPPGLDRLPLPLPFSPDLLWRYQFGFPHLTGAAQPSPSSPLLDYKSQLPAGLPNDPRIWNRDDVNTFLRWAEHEYDLQPFDMDVFQMNGKAMCLLTRTDLSERAPGSGDILYNVLQLLVREANSLQRCLPSSPVTPTSRHHPYPLSPHSHPPTPTWNLLGGGAGGPPPTPSSITSASDLFGPSSIANMHSVSHQHQSAAAAAQLAAHLMAAQSQSVTLSPAPSVESNHTAGGSPQHTENSSNGSSTNGHTVNGQGSNNGGMGPNVGGATHGGGGSSSSSTSSTGSGAAAPVAPQLFGISSMFSSSQSDSDEDYPQLPPRSPKEALSPAPYKSVKNEFFPSNESPEPNTNGRLLWDFLQQLLNDPNQRYTNYIAWKNRDTGVFKIVDPAGLAKLWGIQKNHLSMNYDKMSRALRYYYRVNILRKVQGERHCYQFLRNPTELKNIKNISLLRQQMSPTRPPHTPTAAGAPPSSISSSTTGSVVLTAAVPSHTTVTSVPVVSSAGIPHLPHLPNITIKPEPLDIKYESMRTTTSPPTTTRSPSSDDYDKPTDLSMDGPTDLSASSGRQHINIVCSPDQDSISYYGKAMEQDK